MKISIDSSEPLEDVLRVLGAVYGVTLKVTAEGADATRSATGGSARGGRPRASSTRRQPSRGRRGVRRGSVNGRAPASQAQVRSWARENGHTVSDRGRLPAAVLAAYQAAN